jgi:hypothetical protein
MFHFAPGVVAAIPLLLYALMSVFRVEIPWKGTEKSYHCLEKKGRVLLSVPSDGFFGGRKGAQQMFIYQGAFKVVQRLSRGCPDNAARGYYLLEEGASRSDPERYCPPMIGR